MATEIKFIDRIARIDRMPSSRYGNPRFMLHFAGGASLPTAPDAGLAYGIENPEYRDCDVEVTKNGRGHVIRAEPIN